MEDMRRLVNEDIDDYFNLRGWIWRIITGIKTNVRYNIDPTDEYSSRDSPCAK